MRKKKRNVISLIKNKVKKNIKIFFFVAPFIIAFGIGYRYALLHFKTNFSNDQYAILFGAIGITATLSSLSFSACSSTNRKDKKKIFHDAGERLFHSAILFIITLILQYTSMQKNLYPFFHINLDLPLHLIATGLGAIFFYYGLIYSTISLGHLHIILFKGNEKPLD